MPGAGPLYDDTRERMLADLHEIVRRHGAAHAGVICEAVIAATREFIRTTEGPEAAFNAFARPADAAAAPVLSQRLDHDQQG